MYLLSRWTLGLGILVLWGLALASCDGVTQGGDGPPAPLSQPCYSDLDCKSPVLPHCDPYTGCVGCVLDAHCDADERCVDRACVPPVPCTDNEECSGSVPVCNLVLGECVGCVRDADCGEAAVCQRGSCRDVAPCVNSRDCIGGFVCDRESRHCVQCVTDGDCTEETTCIDHACIPRCASDNDCKSENLLCAHDMGYCVECVAHEDCPEVYHCAGNRCLVDVCPEGETTCSDDGRSIDFCPPPGAELAQNFCRTSSTCVVTGNTAACAPWECEPGSTTCTTDFTHIAVCNDDGLAHREGMDCTAVGGACEFGQCVDIVCDPDAFFCEQNILYRCSITGAAAGAIQDCGTSHYCDADAGACQPHACTPGATTCEDSVVMTCDANGMGFEVGEDCADDDMLCRQGECVPMVCEADTDFCRDGSVMHCEDGGAGESLVQACVSSQFCDPDTASCQTDVCTAGAPTCEGNTAGTCNAEGSGLESGGTDCGDTSQACWAGSCLDVVCTETRFCRDGDVYACVDNGTREMLMTNCGTNQYCDDAAPACRSWICTPGSMGCDQNFISQCNANGSGWNHQTACGANEACVGTGTCLPIICTPNAYYCDAGNVYRCGADGTTNSLNDTCAASEYCQEGVSTCRPDVCTGGQPVCDGALLSTCASDGSGPLAGGTACASGSTCDGGACAPIVCTPDARFCSGGNVNLCNSLGTASSLYSPCAATRFCDEDASPVVCRDDICQAGTAACDGETPATCEPDGGGYTSPGTDCSASGQVCTLSGCANQAVEVIGSASASSTSSNYAYANRFYVENARTLTAIDQYFTVSGTSQFTWFVYENTAATGAYTKIFESLNTSSGSATFHTSGTISVPLQPGHYYLIGVRVAGSATYSYVSQSTPQFISFGYALSRSLLSTGTSALPTSWSPSITTALLYQRLTTE